MKKNIGKTDRAIRLVLGTAAAVLGIYYRSWWGLLSIPLLGTAALGWCGLYSVIGIKTCPLENK